MAYVMPVEDNRLLALMGSPVTTAGYASVDRTYLSALAHDSAAWLAAWLDQLGAAYPRSRARFAAEMMLIHLAYEGSQAPTEHERLSDGIALGFYPSTHHAVFKFRNHGEHTLLLQNWDTDAAQAFTLGGDPMDISFAKAAALAVQFCRDGEFSALAAVV